jgi:hypothetical protein
VRANFLVFVDFEVKLIVQVNTQPTMATSSPSPSPNSSPKLPPKKLAKYPPQSYRPIPIQQSSSSDSSSTLKIGSPLSSASTTLLSSPPIDSSLTTVYLRERGHSISTIIPSNREQEGPPTLTRGISAPPPQSELLESTPTIKPLPPVPPSLLSSSWHHTRSVTPPHGHPNTWWGATQGMLGLKIENRRRPWEEEEEGEEGAVVNAHPPKRKKTVPREQTEGWVHTRTVRPFSFPISRPFLITFIHRESPKQPPLSSAQPST